MLQKYTKKSVTSNKSSGFFVFSLFFSFRYS
nr:MAG TPA: hypothetical protein [Caudoviricetes sp.]